MDRSRLNNSSINISKNEHHEDSIRISEEVKHSENGEESQRDSDKGSEKSMGEIHILSETKDKSHIQLFNNKNNENDKSNIDLNISSVPILNLMNDSSNKQNSQLLNNSNSKIINSNQQQQQFINLITMASDCFDLYINNFKNPTKDPKISEKLDIYEIINLLDVLGIKKSIHEIKAKVNLIKIEKFKDYSSDDKYSKSNFLDLVEGFKDYRIDHKLLIEAFRELDQDNEGIINQNKIGRVNEELKLGLSREEINDIINYFDLEDPKNSNKTPLDFEKFCQLYYQG